jgi:hypothetical protein
VTRPFILLVDSGEDEEPEPRRFGSLATAIAAFEKLDPHWQRFARIYEYSRPGWPPFVTHMRDGRLETP